VTGQRGRVAGIGAVALAVFVAIAVAGLFLVLIGARRSDRPAAPEHYRPASPEHTEQPGATPWLSPARQALGAPQHDELTDVASRSSGVLGEQQHGQRRRET
jgi:hypothetical protein